MQFNDLHRDYSFGQLSRNQLAKSPFDQFRIWYEEANAAGIIDANTMALATATADGKPSCRMVLMQNFDSNGPVFFTNYQSRKAKEIASNNIVSACFYWKELERQVIIEGTIEKTSLQESKDYFDSRTRAKRLGAIASKQDTELESRKILEEEYNKLNQKYADKDEIPLPTYWGGFRITPNYFEFWQGRQDRLHDRFCYKRDKEKDLWIVSRLSP